MTGSDGRKVDDDDDWGWTVIRTVFLLGADGTVSDRRRHPSARRVRVLAPIPAALAEVIAAEEAAALIAEAERYLS